MLIDYCIQLKTKQLSEPLKGCDIEVLNSIVSVPDEKFYEHPEALQALVECSRKPQWRDYFRELGILSKMIGLLSPVEEGTALQLDVLSFIGNCCADNNENRAILLTQSGRLMLMVSNPLYSGRAVIVAYNLCNDWGPGIEEFANENLLTDLVHLLLNDQFRSEETHIFCASELLLMIIQNIKEQDRIRSLDLSIIRAIIKLPIQYPSLEANNAITEAYFEILQSSGLYEYLAQPEMVLTVLSWLNNIVEHKAQDQKARTDNDSAIKHSRPNELLQPIEAKLLLCLSDISASETFLSCNPLDGLVNIKLMNWLQNGQATLVKCACLMLGNSARSNDRCEAMFSKLKLIPGNKSLPQRLLDVIKQTDDQSLIHAALGLLGNLSQPISNKTHLGDLEFVEEIYGILSIKTVTQSVKIAALRVLRLLTKQSWDNTRRLFSRPKVISSLNIPVDMDNTSQAETEQTLTISAEDATMFSLIMTQLWHVEDFHLLVEAGRLIVCVLRNIYSLQLRPEESESLLELIWQDDFAAKFLAFMFQQEKIEQVRFEAFFGAALLSRTEQGAIYFSKALSDDLVKVLEDTVRMTPAMAEPTARSNHNRENALVLVSGLLGVMKSDQQYYPQLRDIMKVSKTDGDTLT